MELLIKALDRTKLVKVPVMVRSKHGAYISDRWKKIEDLTKEQVQKYAPEAYTDLFGTNQAKTEEGFVKDFIEKLTKELGINKLMEEIVVRGITWNTHDHDAINKMRAKMALKKWMLDGNDWNAPTEFVLPDQSKINSEPVEEVTQPDTQPGEVANEVEQNNSEYTPKVFDENSLMAINIEMLGLGAPVEYDDQGYNKIDYIFGKDLYERVVSLRRPLTLKQQRALAKMLIKYRRQLLSYGVFEEDLRATVADLTKQIDTPTIAAENPNADITSEEATESISVPFDVNSLPDIVQTASGESFKIPEQLKFDYARVQAQIDKTEDDRIVELAWKVIAGGTSFSQWRDIVSRGYKTYKGALYRQLDDQAKDEIIAAFGEYPPSKSRINMVYRAIDYLKPMDFAKIGGDGEVIINDFTIDFGTNSYGKKCWIIKEGTPFAVYKIKDQLKEIGAKWDKNRNHWYFPATMSQEEIDNVLEVYRYGREPKPIEGTAQNIGGSAPITGQVDPNRRFTKLASRIPLRSVAPEEYGRIIPTRARKIEGAGRLDTDISRLLRPHQVDGANLCIESMDSYGGFLFADGTGAGKTMELLAVADHYRKQGKSVLIVTPNTGVMETAFGPDAEYLGVNQDLLALAPIPKRNKQLKSSAAYKVEPSTINLTTYSSLHKIKGHADIVMFDEAHYMKNYDSSRSKRGKNLIEKAEKTVYATATPMDKGGHIHYLTGLGIFQNTSFSYIMNQLGYEYVEESFGSRVIGSWKRRKEVTLIDAVKNIEALFDEMEDLGMVVKREVAMDKVKVYHHNVTMPPECHRELEAIERYYMGGTNGEGGGPMKAIMLMAQRRYQEPYKLPYIKEMTLKKLAEGKQVVIFADRINESELTNEQTKEIEVKSAGTIQAMVDMFENMGINVAKIYGDGKVIEEKEKFQSGQCKVAVVTPQKGGAGLSLDDTIGTAPRSMIVITPPFSATDCVQMAGRINRLNTVSDSEIIFVFGDTDVEDWNRNIISEKMRVLHASVQGEIGNIKV